MKLSGNLIIRFLLIVVLISFVSCSNFTTINFNPENSPYSYDLNKYLFCFEESLNENHVEILAKHVDTSQNYIYDINYLHPPGKPISASKDIAMCYMIKGTVSVSMDPDNKYKIDIVSLSWNQEGPTENDIIEAFNKDIIDEFIIKIEKL